MSTVVRWLVSKVSSKWSGVARWISGATPQSRLLIIGGGLATLAAIPLTALDRVPNLCLLERVFGYCPAHGTLHALAALAHGRFAEAVGQNPMVLLIAPVAVALAAADVIRLARDRARRAA